MYHYTSTSMRNFNDSASIQERIFNAIQSGELDADVIDELLTDTIAREKDYLETISFTLSYSEICKRKCTIYELKILLTFVRWCKRGVNSELFDNKTE